MGVEAELGGEGEGLADAEHRDAEDHVVADLRRLPGAGGAAEDGARAHDLEERADGVEGLRRTAGHEGERAGGGADGAARDRRVDRREAGGARLGRDGAGALDVDGRAVDEDGAGGGGRDDLGVDRARGSPRSGAW